MKVFMRFPCTRGCANAYAALQKLCIKRLWVRFADHALQNPGWYSNGGAAAQDQSHNVNA
ncbi:MAG TPA: hypothetical protein DEA72_02595 [Halomonas campaniensis]|nr:hypothetical protein [Halomonas campaniensis]